jgi:hypothetical protein
VELRSHHLQAAHVKIDGARSDRISPRHGYARSSEPCEQGAQHLYGGPHLRYELVRRLLRQRGRRVDDEAISLEAHVRAQTLEHLHHQCNVGDVGDAFEHHLPGHEEGSGHEL